MGGTRGQFGGYICQGYSDLFVSRQNNGIRCLGSIAVFRFILGSKLSQQFLFDLPRILTAVVLYELWFGGLASSGYSSIIEAPIDNRIESLCRKQGAYQAGIECR